MALSSRQTSFLEQVCMGEKLFMEDKSQVHTTPETVLGAIQERFNVRVNGESVLRTVPIKNGVFSERFFEHVHRVDAKKYTCRVFIDGFRQEVTWPQWGGHDGRRAMSPNMAALYKTLFEFCRILKFLNYSYFVKIMTGKPKLGKLTYMTKLTISGFIKVVSAI